MRKPPDHNPEKQPPKTVPITRPLKRNLIIAIVFALSTAGILYQYAAWQFKFIGGGLSNSPELSSALEEIRQGKILFNPPNEMEQGKKERVEARIPYEDIGDVITKHLKGRGKPELENIQVGRKMSVTLTADEDVFKIKKYSTDEQLVAGRPFAQWEWDVTPLEYGEQQLHLKAVINLDNAGKGEATYDIPVIDRIVNVKVNPAFIAEQAAKDKDFRNLLIGSGSVVGALGVIYASIKAWRNRRKNKEENARGKPWETAP